MTTTFEEIFEEISSTLRHSDLSDLASDNESRASNARIQLALDLTRSIMDLIDVKESKIRYFKDLQGNFWKCPGESVIRVYRGDNDCLVNADETHVYIDANVLSACLDVQEIDEASFNKKLTNMLEPF